MDENATISPAMKGRPVYVNKKGQVFFKGVYQPEIKGDHENQKVITEITEVAEPSTRLTETVPEKKIEDIPAATPVEQPKSTDYDALIYSLSQKINDLSAQVEASKQVPQTPIVQTVIQQKEKVFGEGIRNIPVEDFDKKGATFITYGLGRQVSVYMKDGAEYLAPYDRGLYFKYDSSDKRRQGKEEHYIHFSKYSTHSKKEIEFLRGNPEYNVTIFENVNRAVNTNPELVTKMAAATTMISSMRQDALFARASSLGFDVSLGYDYVKNELISYTYNELCSQERMQAEKRINESEAAQSLFMQPSITEE